MKRLIVTKTWTIQCPGRTIIVPPGTEVIPIEYSESFQMYIVAIDSMAAVAEVSSKDLMEHTKST